MNRKIKKNILKVTLVAAFALVAGYNVYISQKTDGMSDLAIANIEALASNGEANPNISYGYGLKDCKNSQGAVTGAKCTLTHPYDECNNKSTWGNCY